MRFQNFKSWFTPPVKTQPLFLEYQIRVTPKIYGFLFAVLSLVAIRNYLTQTGPLALVFFVLASLALPLGIIRYKPIYFRAASRIMTVGLTAATLASCFYWPSEFIPPALILFPFVVLMVTFTDGLVASLVVLGIALSMQAYVGFQVDLTQVNNVDLLTTLVLDTVLVFVGALVFFKLFINLFQVRAELGQRLDDSVGKKEKLLKDFFKAVENPASELNHSFQKKPAHWKQAQKAIGIIVSAMKEIKQKVLQSSQEQIHLGDVDAGLEKLRNKITKVFLWCGVVAGPIVVGVSYFGPGYVQEPEVAIFIAGTALLLLGRKKSRLPWIRQSSILVYTVIISWGVWNTWRMDKPTYDTLYYLVIIFYAVIIDNLWLAGLVCAAGLSATGVWAWGVTPATLIESKLLSNTALAMVGMFVMCFFLWDWLKRILKDVHSKEKSLQQLSDLRDRLMATLFHDIANPMAVINTLVQLQEMQGPEELSEENAAQAQRMSRKITRVIHFTREFSDLENTDQALPQSSVSVTVLFKDMLDIFGSKLKAKNLKVTLDLNEEKVLAHADLLGLSVLSNLFSNAIKFSSIGSEINLTATRLGGDQVLIIIKDQGPGISKEIIEKLKTGKPLASTRGTAGEKGDGQGLRLAQVYLSKMNGQLEILNRPEGGSEIRVMLLAG